MAPVVIDVSAAGGSAVPTSGGVGPRPPQLYMSPLSAPAIAATLCADLLQVPYVRREVDLFKGEQREPDYLKVNPLGKVPAFVDDDGFLMTESRAIMTYLAERYGGPTCHLYPPHSPEVRGRVQNVLMLDIGTLYPAVMGYVYPQIFPRGGNAAALSSTELAERLRKLDGAMSCVEQMLVAWARQGGDGTGPYLAQTGHLTLADIAVFCSCHVAMMVDYDFSKYPELSAWIRRCRSILMSPRPDMEGGVTQPQYFNALIDYKAKLNAERASAGRK